MPRRLNALIDPKLIGEELARRHASRDTSKEKWRDTLDLEFLRHQQPVVDCKAKAIVLVKGRGAGGTMYAARHLIDICINKEPGSSHLWVDTVHRNIDRYVKRYFIPALRGMPKRHYSWNSVKLTLTFSDEVGGSVVDFGSAQHPEMMEGFGYRHIWLNEAGIILRSDALYYNTLLPMGRHPKGTYWHFIGAPKGRNLFAKLIAQGKNPAEFPDWKTFHWTSYDNPTIPREEIEKWKQEMPEPVFRQEVLAEIVDDVQGYFRNVDALFSGEPEGPQPGTGYVIGLDLARSRDFTVCWVGRADNRRGVHKERWRKLPWEVQEDRIQLLSERYNNAPLIADATGLGSGVVESLQRRGLSVLPIVFNMKSKMDILSGLAIDIEQEAFSVCEDDDTSEELKNYEMIQLPGGGYRLSAPPGQHDDCVIALALMRYGFGAQDQEIIVAPSLREQVMNAEKYN